MLRTSDVHNEESTEASTDHFDIIDDISTNHFEQQAPYTLDFINEASSSNNPVETKVESSENITSKLSSQNNVTMEVEKDDALPLELKFERNEKSKLECKSECIDMSALSDSSKRLENDNRLGMQVKSFDISTFEDQLHASQAHATTISTSDAIEEDPSTEQMSMKSSLSPLNTNINFSYIPNTNRKELYDDMGAIKSRNSEGNIVLTLTQSTMVETSTSSKTLATHRWKMAYEHAKKLNAMKNLSMSSIVGTGAKLHGHAMGVLSTRSTLRRTLFKILYHPKLEYVLLALILSHLIVLILKAEHSFVTSYHPSKESLQIADTIITIIYTLECACRITTLGLFGSSHAYLQNNFNKLDLVIVVDSWIHIIWIWIKGEDRWIRLGVLRLPRALLALRLFDVITDVLAIIAAIRECFSALKTFMIFTLMFLSFFALLGVQFFAGVFHNRCRRAFDLAPNIPDRPCYRSKKLYKLYDGHGKVFQTNSLSLDNCNVYFTGSDLCMYAINPNYGATHFDNFAASLLIVFQVITFEGWSLINNWARNTTGLGADAYFFVLIICGSYFLVNIYIAVISSVFLKVRQEHQVLLKRYHRQRSASFAAAVQMASLLKEVIISDDAKLTWAQRLRRRTTNRLRQTFSRQGTSWRRTMSRAVDWDNPMSYMRRISGFDLSGNSSFADLSLDDLVNRRSLSGSFSRSLSQNVSYITGFGRSLSRTMSMTGQQILSMVSSQCWMIVHSKVFKYGVLFFISVNMAALCSMRAKMTDRHIKNIQYLEISLLAVFGVELLVRFLAGGLFEFLDEGMNVIDFVVIVISFWNTGPNRKFVNLTPIRMLRWFYIKRSKKIHRGGEGVPILTAILRSVGQLSAVYIFLFLIIIIFSIFSMELWGGQMNFADGYPRANHDSFGQAILLWFTVTTGESWVNYMWDVMRPGVKNRWVAPFIFVLYFILTAFITLNLIIATILEETELTDNQKKYIQKREHLKWLQTKHYRHLSSTRHSDWIIDAVESAQRRFSGVRQRMASMKVSRMSTFPSFRSKTTKTQEQEKEDVVLSTATKSGTDADDSHINTVEPQGVSMPTKRISDSTMELPGSIANDEALKAKTIRRSSIDVLPSSQAPVTIRRRHSQQVDSFFIRSGFDTSGLSTGESKTALQSALLAVVDDKAIVAAKKQNENRDKPSTTAERVATPYARTKSGRRISFVLSEFGATPSFEIRAVPWWMNHRSLFLFTPENYVRRLIIRIIEHKFYMIYEYGYIILAMWCFVRHQGNYFFGDPSLNYEYFADPRINQAYTIFLGVDILLKIIAYGFIFTPEAFLSDPYNWIEIPTMFFTAMGWKFYLGYNSFARGWNRTATLFVNLRPLTLLGRFRGIRTLINNIVKTMPVILQVFVFVFVIYAIFAVIGIQLYANRFRYCTDTSVTGFSDCVGLYRNEIGVLTVRTWVNQLFHFDTFGDAMLALFIGSTFDSWPDYFLYPAMDLAHKPELQPQRNNSPSQALYFITFVCIGGFFILRMFVGVFIDQFGIISGSKLLTERQKLWRDTNRLIQGLNPRIVPTEPSNSQLRRLCFRLVYSRRFELTVVFIVLANYVYLTTRHEDSSNNIPSDMYDDGGQNSAVEMMFVCLYIIEAALKLLGTRLTDWWDDKWNLIELCMLIISASCLYPGLLTYVHVLPVPGQTNLRDYPGIPALVLSEPYPARQYVGAFFIFLRIFRITRYFLDLKIMLTATVIALPAMIDTMGIMFVVVLFYMGIGVSTFNNLYTGSCINSKLGPNFKLASHSFATMMQIMTLDNWSCLLTDITVKSPFCIRGTCGYAVGGIVFMLSAVALTTYILSNIFVAQILDTITFGLINEKALLAPAHLLAFQAQWSQKKYDPKCIGYIGQHKLKEFLIDLDLPLGGRNKPSFIKWYTRIDYEVSHFRDAKGVAFRPLLETVCLYKVGPRGLELPVRIERERQIQSIYQNGAVIKIQALVRGFLQRRKDKKEQHKQKINKEKLDAPLLSGQDVLDKTHLDLTTSDTDNKKSVHESSLSLYCEGKEGHISTAASSSYYTPLSNTPPDPNDTMSVASSSEIERAEP